MTEARGVKALSVIIDHHRAIHNLVAAVLIHIGNHVVMKALSKPLTTIAVAIPSPLLFQLMVLTHIVGNHLMTGIDATGKEDAGFVSVEIGRTEIVLR